MTRSQLIHHWKKWMNRNRSFSKPEIEELESHLWEEMDEMVATDGCSEEEAFHKVISNLGNRTTLDSEYKKTKTISISRVNSWAHTHLWQVLLCIILLIALMVSDYVIVNHYSRGKIDIVNRGIMNFIIIPKNPEELYFSIRDSDNKSGTSYSFNNSKISKELESLDSISFIDNRLDVPISSIIDKKIIVICYEDGKYGISFEKDVKPMYFGLIKYKDSDYCIVIDDHQNCWISQTAIFTNSTYHIKLLPKEYTVHYYEYDNENLDDRKNPSFFMSLYDEHYHTVMFEKSAIYPYLNSKTKKELSVINNKNGGIIGSKEPFFNSPNNYHGSSTLFRTFS